MLIKGRKDTQFQLHVGISVLIYSATPKYLH